MACFDPGRPLCINAHGEHLSVEACRGLIGNPPRLDDQSDSSSHYLCFSFLALFRSLFVQHQMGAKANRRPKRGALERLCVKLRLETAFSSLSLVESATLARWATVSCHIPSLCRQGCRKRWPGDDKPRTEATTANNPRRG